MRSPENVPSLMPSDPSEKLSELLLVRPEIARVISLTEEKYQFRRFLPETVDAGLNFPTALAAIHAIDSKGQQEGWEHGDLQNALSVTRVALTTAGFAHAREGLVALLTGSTGGLREIMEKILPPDASKGVQFATRVMVRVNAVDNMRVVLGLLLDEKRLERRLLNLTRLQRDILLDPGKTHALLEVLNSGFYTDQTSQIRLQPGAQAHLQKISPFSLEDMSAVTKFFNAVEWYRNAAIQIDARSLGIQTELMRIRAAGVQVGRIASSAMASVTETLLLVSGGSVGGALGGIGLAVDEGKYQIGKALDSISKKREARRTPQLSSPR